MAFKLNYALVCDKVDREPSGKMIFSGVYGENIIVRNVPVTLPLALALNFVADAAGTFSMGVQVLDKNDKVVFILKGEGSTERAGIGITGINGIAVTVTEETTLKFQISQSDGPWETVASLPVAIIPEAKVTS
jgi:hypothetical protein